jgi:D-glycero-D-manno-heptose 1,7-bisphosphate phosphatase
VGGLRKHGVFLDRDGTLNVKPREHEYVTSEAEFVWLPGAAEGTARLARAGYVLAVVSNQRGVARGLVQPSVLCRVEELIQEELARYGYSIAAFRYCMHDLEEACDCRKPKPGMILQVARELDLDLAGSWVIGDSQTDIRSGKAAGCRTALIADSGDETEADIVAQSLAEVSRLVVGWNQPVSDRASDSNSSTSA